MAVRKGDVARPLLPMEAVDVPEIGGEVIVRGLTLSQRLELAIKFQDAGFRQMPEMLARCVVDADHELLFTADEWEAFGAKHFDAVLRLADRAQRLSGFDKDAAGK